MLGKSLRRRFESKGTGPYGVSGLLKTLVQTPKRVWSAISEPTSRKQPIHENTTEMAFDEVSNEWQALVVGGAFDAQTYSMYEQVAQNNFGTVDNPHVIFTSDAPFRYVGCTGQPNPDDYEGHEFLIFMLREGSLQRCPVCGQVYKLVRLRDEYSEEMDYYLSGLLPYEHQEFGEADHWSHNSLIRMMPQSYEHSNFPVESTNTYRMINPDDHDKVLVDPAYRMKKLTESEQVYRVYMSSMVEIQKQYEKNTFDKRSKYLLNRSTYESLIDAEIALRKFDRQYKKLSKFHARQFLDIENHERREKRMLEKNAQRQLDSYTVFFGGLSEEELMYKDYFQTEIEASGENEAFELNVDEEVIRSLPEYRLENYRLSSAYSGAPTDDAASIVDKIIFNFKHRRQIDSLEDYKRRQSRLVERQVERATSGNVEDEVAKKISSGSSEQKTAAEAQYLDLLFSDSLQQFADYYETDGEENLKILKASQPSEIAGVITSFKDYTKIGTDARGYYSIAKRRWNNGIGLTGNLLEEFRDLTGFVLPKLDKLSNISQANMLTNRDSKYILEAQKSTEKLE